jgi:hypothetical protein
MFLTTGIARRTETVAWWEMEMFDLNRMSGYVEGHRQKQENYQNPIILQQRQVRNKLGLSYAKLSSSWANLFPSHLYFLLPC